MQRESHCGVIGLGPAEAVMRRCLNMQREAVRHDENTTSKLQKYSKPK